jgi:hypothetical protein
MNLVILAFLIVNSVITIFEEKVVGSQYTSLIIPWSVLVSMCISVPSIFYGLRWNNKTLFRNKSSLYAWINSITINTFSLLSWATLVIAWAEFSILFLFASVVISGIAVSVGQPEPFQHNPFLVAPLSAIFPTLSLPSTYKQPSQASQAEELSQLLHPSQASQAEELSQPLQPSQAEELSQPLQPSQAEDLSQPSQSSQAEDQGISESQSLLLSNSNKEEEQSKSCSKDLINCQTYLKAKQTDNKSQSYFFWCALFYFFNIIASNCLHAIQYTLRPGGSNLGCGNRISDSRKNMDSEGHHPDL